MQVRLSRERTGSTGAAVRFKRRRGAPHPVYVPLRLERLEDRLTPAGPTISGFDQWADVTNAWVNGSLGSSNAIYLEGDTVPD